MMLRERTNDPKRRKMRRRVGAAQLVRINALALPHFFLSK